MSNKFAQQYIDALDALVQTYDSATKDDNGHVPDRTAFGLLPRARTAIEKISGKDSHYSRQAEEIIAQNWHESYKAERIVGIVEALRADVLSGFLISFSELVRGDLFLDFVQMADYLQQEGYKDAAAVIAGGVLEAHLRQLCVKYGIDTTSIVSGASARPKKAVQLNQDLGKVAYTLFDQKHIITWLDLRNSAAHGKYGEYSVQQVAQFIEWLRDFMVRNPA